MQLVGDLNIFESGLIIRAWYICWMEVLVAIFAPINSYLSANHIAKKKKSFKYNFYSVGNI